MYHKSTSLTQLLQQRQDLWRGKASSHRSKDNSISTGFNSLDETLPERGWPSNGLIEIVYSHSGGGELRCLLPALQRINQAKQNIAWIATPHILYAPALLNYRLDPRYSLMIDTHSEKDALWAMEQCLRSPHCGAIMAWSNTLSTTALRRLQLACEQQRCLSILFRHHSTRQTHTSPAALRLSISTTPAGQAHITLLKCRSGWPGRSLQLTLPVTEHQRPLPITRNTTPSLDKMRSAANTVRTPTLPTQLNSTTIKTNHKDMHT